MRDGSKVAECLKKAVRIASNCMDKVVQLQLLVEILNSYVLYFEKGCPEVRRAVMMMMVVVVMMTME